VYSKFKLAHQLFVVTLSLTKYIYNLVKSMKGKIQLDEVHDLVGLQIDLDGVVGLDERVG
jgi:hypothetical protein